MNLKPLFLIVLLALVGLSYQNETNNEVSDELQVEQIKMAEVDQIISDARDFPKKVKDRSETVTKSMIDAVRFLQNAVKKSLDNLASFIRPTAYQNNLLLPSNTALVHALTNKVLSSTAFSNGVDQGLQNMKLSVDKKAQQLINGINSGEQIFNSGIIKLSNEVVKALDKLKQTSPSILSEKCSQAVRDLKSSLTAISNVFLKCAAKTFFSRAMAQEVVEDEILERIESQKNEFVRLYKCVTTDEPKTIKKIIRCVELRNLWDAYNFYKELTANVDDTVLNALDGIEKSFTFVGCVKEEVKDSENTDRFWALLQSTMACNAEEPSNQIQPVSYQSVGQFFNDNNKVGNRGSPFPYPISNHN